MRIAIDIRKVHEFGVGAHIWNLVRSLSAVDNGNEYFLLGSSRQFLEFGPLGPNFRRIDVPEEDSFWNFHVRVPLALRSRRIDLFHVPHYEAPLFTSGRLMVTVHDCAHLLFPPQDSSKFDKYKRYEYMKRVLRAAGHVIAVSGSTRQDLLKIFGLPEEKVSVVHNALDGRFLGSHGPEEQKQTLERFQLKDPFILYTGQIKPHKNVHRLIEAFAVLKSELGDSKKYRNLKLVIIGDRIGRHQYLRRTVVRSGVPQDVRFLGFLPSPVLQIFYEAAVVYVQPSLYEGFGLAPLEAMANRTPVVASNTSSLPEVLGDAALLVNPENVFEIARAMKQLLIDQVLRQETIEKGLRQVGKFSWTTSAERVVETYRGVLENKKLAAVTETL